MDITTPADALDANKALVRRLIDDVINAGRLEPLDELCTVEMATAARAWITPFRRSFPDVRMETVVLVAEGDLVVGRFRCSGTHLGTWQGHPPTRRRFEHIDEVYFFTIGDDRIADMWGVEDNARRIAQLGLTPRDR